MHNLSREEALIEYIQTTDQTLSRTARDGTAATGVHVGKRASRLTGANLHRALVQNRAATAAFIDWQSEQRPRSAFGMGATLTGLAWIVNFGIIAGELYRAWPYVTPGDGANSALPPVPPEGIADGLERLAGECAAIAHCDRPAQSRAIAHIEWEIGIGPLHPFYDGCGRVSRCFSTMLCLWHGRQPPIHISRETYMSAATKSEADFIEYWISAPVATLPPITPASTFAGLPPAHSLL